MEGHGIKGVLLCKTLFANPGDQKGRVGEERRKKVARDRREKRRACGLNLPKYI